ncbi:MAG: glycosyltransferase family 2 protein [Chitinivibrionales bacterium]|nr:glycosyltransferase family 2 protein [Chitinivibrionales bacterium]
MPPEARISIVMPAFNAADKISGVLDRIAPALWEKLDSVLIVNDGSRDQTGAIAEQCAFVNHKIKVINLAVNGGYGAAVRAGLVRCRQDGSDFAVCLHADGQYPPEVIEEFIRFMQTNGVDVLQGSRIASGTALSGGMPLYKYIANRVLTFWENRAFGMRFSDFHSGFLIYAKKALATIPFDKLSDSFDFDVEVIACCRALGLTLRELPVPTHYGDEISHVKSIPYGLRICAIMLRYCAGGYHRACALKVAA